MKAKWLLLNYKKELDTHSLFMSNFEGEHRVNQSQPKGCDLSEVNFVNFIDKLSQHIYNKKMSIKEAAEKLFSLNQKPFDIEMEFNNAGGIISFPITNDTEIIKFDSNEIKDLNPDKIDRIAKYLLNND